MTIIIDSRERRPLYFGCDCVKQKLEVGDYGAAFSQVVFERKSIPDLYGTLTFGYDRFRREIQKAAELKIRLIIAVEGTKSKVLKGYKHSARDPESIIKQIETIHKKYGVETMFFGNRLGMANFICDFFLVEYDKYLEGLKDGTRPISNN